VYTEEPNIAWNKKPVLCLLWALFLARVPLFPSLLGLWDSWRSCQIPTRDFSPPPVRRDHLSSGCGLHQRWHQQSYIHHRVNMVWFYRFETEQM
jgi:hypothetical protein